MKKTLALVLAFCMVFSSISFAFADTTTLTKTADAVTCEKLGMVKGTGGEITAEYYAQESTRLQAAIMVLRLKGLEEEALAFAGDKNFADMANYAWAGGKNVAAYLLAHPELGFVGDGVKFNADQKIDEQQLYKVMLTALGYKQTTPEVVGDYAWADVLTFAKSLGLAPQAPTTFTNNDIARITVEALKAKNKDGKVLVDALVAAGTLTAEKVAAAGIVVAAPVTVAVDTVKAIGNTVVEVVFEEDVDAAAAGKLENYSIEGLEIKSVTVAGTDTVRVETAAQTTGKLYTLTVGAEKVKFAGVAKVTGTPELKKATGTDEQTVELEFDKAMDFATATNVANYTIANATVVKAEVDGKVITLTTEGLVANKTYTVKVTNLNSVDAGLLKSASKSFVAKTDKTAPKLADGALVVMTNTRLLVTFNEDVTKASAENVANYSIKAGTTELAIESIEMVEDNQVEITTASQKSGTKYELVVNNIVDTKVLANTMTKEAKKTFYGKAEDKTAPTLLSMEYLSKTLILVNFTDASRLAKDSALDINNYELTNDISAVSAKMLDADDADCKSVMLEVSEMTIGKSYKLTVNDVTDEYGNVMKTAYKTSVLNTASLTAAKVDKVEAYEKTIVVTFNKELPKASAENIANYSVDEEVGTPVKAVYKASTKTVTLTTGVEMKAGKKYKLTIDGLVDLAGSVITVKPTFIASATSIDTDAPEVEYIEMLNANVIAVTFNEEMKVGGTIAITGLATALTAVDSNDDGTVLYFINNTTKAAITGTIVNNQYTVAYSTTLLDISGNALVLADVPTEYKNVEVNAEAIEDIVFEGAEQTRVNEFKLMFSGKLGTTTNNVTLAVSDTTYAGVTALDSVDTDDDDDSIVLVGYTTFKAGKNYRFDLTGFKGLLGEAVTGEGVVSSKEYVDLSAGLEDDMAPYLDSVKAITRTKVEINYNEELKKNQSMTFEIRDEDNKVQTTVTGKTSTTEYSKKVTIATNNLEAGKSYILIAKGQFKDLAGNSSEKSEEFSFEGTNVVTSNYVTVNMVNEMVIKVALYEGTIATVDVTGGQGSYALDGTDLGLIANADGEITVSQKLYEGQTYTVTVTDGNANTITTTFEGLVAKDDAVVGEDLAIAEAGNVALTLAATGAVNAVVMPTVAAGFTIAVKTTSDALKYDTAGKLIADGTSNVVYTVTHTASTKTADTGTVVVTVTVTP